MLRKLTISFCLLATSPLSFSAGYGSFQLGLKANANGDLATAVGAESAANNAGATAVGGRAVASGLNSSSYGLDSKAIDEASFAAAGGEVSSSSGVGKEGIAIGNKAKSDGWGTTSIGGQSEAKGDSATSLGYGSKTNGDYSTALGRGAVASASSSTAIGAFSEAQEENVVSIGNSSLQRRLQNLSSGINDNDGVNVSQLNKEKNERIASNTHILTKSQSYTDERVQQSDALTTDSISKEAHEREKGDQETLKSANNYTDSAIDNNNYKTNEVIKNERKERIESNKNALKSANIYTDKKVNDLEDKINRKNKKQDAGIASAVAIGSIPQNWQYQDHLGMGVGGYNGQGAVAMKYGHKIKDNIAASVSVGLDTTGNAAYGAGIDIGW